MVLASTATASPRLVSSRMHTFDVSVETLEGCVMDAKEPRLEEEEEEEVREGGRKGGKMEGPLRLSPGTCNASCLRPGDVAYANRLR
ncbi:unnamed protein product [Hydatigera taeniaeformis]|uniref:Uncharacterized protein n=1 Tax=Hydatigena taeniaeformis TaxID=6205 RepID=A0A0R3WV07_HYDTA|nr:unnamed protein product [Hydatigera taeniaeformis]